VYCVRIGIKVNLIGTDIAMMLGTPPGGKGAGLRPNGARMAWLQRPATWQMASVSNQRNKADPHLRENSVPMEPNNSERHELHDSSSHTGEDVCLLPYSDDQSTGDKHRKSSFL